MRRRSRRSSSSSRGPGAWAPRPAILPRSAVSSRCRRSARRPSAEGCGGTRAHADVKGASAHGRCSRPDAPTGVRRGLTNYGDPEFSMFVRGAYARGAGLTPEDLGPPRHRPRPDVERVQPLPPPSARGRRGRQARRVAGRRPAARVPDDLARRDLPVADEHALPEPHGDGHRGDDPRPADGRRGAPRRLRQDPAGPADGRGQRGPARDRRDRRPDADRAATRACGSARARTAGGSGPSTGRARSTRRAWRRSRASCSPPPAPAW